MKIGYRGSLSSRHPNYLFKWDDNHLFLNLVDSNQMLHFYNECMFRSALNFIDRNIGSKTVLIHCNKGMSRSPAIGLVFLAKRKKMISNESYQKAKKEFIKIYPYYQPNIGIERYLTEHWKAAFLIQLE